MKRKPPSSAKPPKTKQHRSLLPAAIGLAGGVAVSTLAFWFFKEQAEHVVEGTADRYDSLLLEVVQAAETPQLTRVFEGFTHLGSHVAIGTAAGLTAVAMVRKGRTHDALTVIVSTGGAMALNTILKNIFQRQRPIELARRIKLPKSHSFPSGHSLLSAATYPIVAHHLVENHPPFTQMAAHTAAFLVITAVGMSRVYFGVHFPSDVLGGFAAGFGWLGLTSLSHSLVTSDHPTARPTAESV